MKTTPISARTPVNEIVRRLPGALAVFSRHGIDSCCGGALPLNEAAEAQRVDVAGVLDELGKIASEGP